MFKQFLGDVNSIAIGDGVSVGDRVMIHCSGISNKSATNIGNNVIIGVGAVIHGCTIEDEVVIGDNAIVLDGAVLQKNSAVAPGSLVLSGKIIPSGELWSGIPATFSRKLTSSEIEGVVTTATDIYQLSTGYAAECAKTWQEVELFNFEYDDALQRNERYYPEPTKEVKFSINY